MLSGASRLCPGLKADAVQMPLLPLASPAPAGPPCLRINVCVNGPIRNPRDCPPKVREGHSATQAHFVASEEEDPRSYLRAHVVIASRA